MKLKETALANASGALGALFFLACYILVLTAPDVYKNIAQSWAHGVDLSSIWNPRMGNFMSGLISFTAASWISGWAFAWLYNKFVK